MATRQGHGKYLSYYRFGATTMYASRMDQRCSYCMYVPEDYVEDGDQYYPLVVVMHGTGRDAQRYRDSFAEFAEHHQCMVLAPLFPAGIGEPEELHNYKYLEHAGMRFDLILLDMIEEVQALYRIAADRFLLTGFSGGGHFTHRFLYAHPHRLLGAAVGAPGVVTLPELDRPWPAGLGGLERLTGRPVDLTAIARVPVQLVIGELDTETWEIGIDPSMPVWIEGVNDHGVDRQRRMQALKAGLETHGVDVQHVVVPGAAHEGAKMGDAVQAFFAEVLAAATSADVVDRRAPASVPEAER